mgnify:FL=1
MPTLVFVNVSDNCDYNLKIQKAGKKVKIGHMHFKSIAK